MSRIGVLALTGWVVAAVSAVTTTVAHDGSGVLMREKQQANIKRAQAAETKADGSSWPELQQENDDEDVEQEVSVNQHSVSQDSNLYGTAQAECGTSTCGVDPPAIHAICVSLPADFCDQTKQSDWCTAEAEKPHCVCLGAWSLYVKEGNSAPDVTCDAVPGSIFTDDYISSWSSWNGNEIGGQEADGLQALFDKCNTGSAAATFKTTFCTFVSGSTKLSADQKSTLSTHASCS